MADRRPSFLYRIYDREGDLLYIGLTGTTARIDSHVQSQPWGDAIASIQMTRCANKELGLVAEREAIRRESPRFNIPAKEVNPETARRRVVRAAMSTQPVAYGPYMGDGAIWEFLDYQGRSAVWLSRQTGCSESDIVRMRNNEAPMSLDFRRQAAEAFQVPDYFFIPPEMGS